VKIVGHILGKDLRRLRWLLLAWLVVVFSRVAVTAARSDLAFEDITRQLALDNVSGLLMFVDMLMLVLLVSLLVHDEPLVGADAFWLTRPIPRATLMMAKLVFAGLFLIAAPAIVQSTAVASVTRAAGHSVRLIPGRLFSQSLWVAAVMAVASLTGSLTRFLLAMVGAGAAVVLASAAFTTLIFMTAEETSYPSPGLADLTTVIVGSWLCLAVAVAVVAMQYRVRRQRLAFSVGIAGLIVSASLAEVWPWRFARVSEPDPGAWSRDPARVAAVLTAGEPHVSDELGIRRRAMPRKQIAAPIRFAGVPPRYVSSVGVRSRLEFPDGSAVQSAQGISVPVRRDGGDPWLFDSTAPVRAALPQIRLLQPSDEPRFTQWPVVLTVTADEYQRFGATPGRLTATIEAFLQESRLVGSIPLVEGARLGAESLQFELRRVVRRPDGCSVLLREIAEGAGRPGIPRSFRYLLRNRPRGEAVLGDNEQITNGSLSFSNAVLFGGWSVEGRSASGFGFFDRVERYPARSTFTTAGQIDAGWLADADLAVIETVYAGRVSRPLVVEEFRMRQ
jgi:ABC-type transport system involved in multi-copper enzyme maturation permease subunit